MGRYRGMWLNIVLCVLCAGLSTLFSTILMEDSLEMSLHMGRFKMQCSFTIRHFFEQIIYIKYTNPYGSVLRFLLAIKQEEPIRVTKIHQKTLIVRCVCNY